jgi:hypothetical protein
VREATKAREIDYPVAVDNEYKVWNAFDNHYWPALYLADRDGTIRDHHFGEGRYEQSERVIQRLLGVERELITVEGIGVEAEADWAHLRTPETYLGYERSQQFASPGGAAVDELRAYEVPDHLRLNQWGLAGEWTVRPEGVVLGKARGSIAFRFHAQRASRAVFRSATADPLPPARGRWGPGRVARGRRRRGRQRRAAGRARLPARAPARRRPRADARDHVPRARRRSLRVHVRLDSEDSSERVMKVDKSWH